LAYIPYSMKLHRLPLLAVVATFALPHINLNAQTTVATDPVGFTTISVTPGTGTARQSTMLSIPLLDVDSTMSGLATGTISAVTSNSIVVSNAGWTPGALSQPATPFVIQVTSGPAAGRFFLIASSATTGGASGGAALVNTASNVFISTIDLTPITNNLANAGVTAGNNFKIYACDTLSWFGSPASTGIRGGTNAASADNLIVTINGTPTTYFYSTTVSNWVRTPTINSANVALSPNSGIMYSRLGSNALSFVSTGQVPVTNRIAPIKNSGITVLSQYWPVNSTLNGLGLQSVPGWVGGTNQVSTDNVTVIVNGTPTTYYYHVSSTATNWRRFPLPTSQNTVSIPVGAAIQINKKGSAPGFSSLNQAVPYNLN
jgi:hypothetical protein